MVLARICVWVNFGEFLSKWRSGFVPWCHVVCGVCVVFLWVVSCCVMSCHVILRWLYCVLLLPVLSVSWLPSACCSNWVAFSVIVLVFYVSS